MVMLKECITNELPKQIAAATREEQGKEEDNVTGGETRSKTV
jgi:hypothetical protein